MTRKFTATANYWIQKRVPCTIICLKSRHDQIKVTFFQICDRILSLNSIFQQRFKIYFQLLALVGYLLWMIPTSWMNHFWTLINFMTSHKLISRFLQIRVEITHTIRFRLVLSPAISKTRIFLD